jgi:hypothetical protein
MRRLVIVGVLAGVGILVARVRVPKLHERLSARCDAMFQRMPDTFPPKQMMRGIEEILVKTGLILDLLETSTDEAAAPAIPDRSTEPVHHAA